ncbi:MAG: site-2 protease family protein [Candidatus Woesearchaeota archaeon]
MNSSWRIARIFGIDIKLHLTWWFVFVLVIWSLSSSFFPQFFPGYGAKTYIFMGIMATILLFLSVLLHELSHCLVAKARRIRVESITLFFFGGVAGISDEEISPSSELLMALAGPIFSLILAALFFGITLWTKSATWIAISFYLYQLNLVLALFNLIPGFPLDGGRALRAILNWHYRDLKKATKIAVFGGKLFAGVLVFFGVVQLWNQTSSGLWLLMLGGFLYVIAGASYEQVLFKEVLNKIFVSELMVKQITSLKPTQKFSEFTQKYSNSEEEVFLVKDKNFFGILDARRIQKTSREAQEKMVLKQLALPLNTVRGLQKEDNAYTAFKCFAEENMEILPVYQKSKVIGYLTRRVLMHRLIWSLKYGVPGKVSSKFNKKSSPPQKKNETPNPLLASETHRT